MYARSPSIAPSWHPTAGATLGVATILAFAGFVSRHRYDPVRGWCTLPLVDAGYDWT